MQCSGGVVGGPFTETFRLPGIRGGVGGGHDRSLSTGNIGSVFVARRNSRETARGRRDEEGEEEDDGDEDEEETARERLVDKRNPPGASVP